MLSFVVLCCLIFIFHVNYHELSINFTSTVIHGQLYGNYMFCYCHTTILHKSNQFFYLFFSALALFPPFSSFFLSEAVFYFLLDLYNVISID